MRITFLKGDKDSVWYVFKRSLLSNIIYIAATMMLHNEKRRNRSHRAIEVNVKGVSEQLLIVVCASMNQCVVVKKVEFGT